MKYTIPPILATLFLFLPTVALAADYSIDAGTTETISGSLNLATPDRIDNNGIVSITDSGVLNITDGVVNINPQEGLQGLDLGVVRNAGQINSAAFIRFQEGSLIGGTVISGGNIAFDGASKITGSITAKQLVINASKEKNEDGSVKIFEIDLTGSGAGLDVEELVINSVTKIDMEEGKTLELGSLYIGTAGTSLVVSENIVVNGNYTGTTGTTIGSKPNDESVFEGTITLLGGGAKVDGENNVIAQSDIFAANLEVGNYTAVENTLKVHGNLTVLEGGAGAGEESRLLLNSAIMTQGKLTVEKNGVIRINESNQDAMIYHNYYYFNGIFLGGFDLQDNAVLGVVESDQSISIAIGGTSTVAAAARIEAGSINIAGITSDGLGVSKLQVIENAGNLVAESLLHLNNITVKNGQTGEIKAGAIRMLGSSVLDLTSSGESGGGLEFIGDKRVLDIGSSAMILATGKTLNFTGVEVINKNSDEDGAIIAEQLIFGEGGSLAGSGFYDTGANFKNGSKLKLDDTGHLIFNDNGVVFEEGAIIEATIGNDGVGVMVTEGKIVMEEGVLLEITDGSNYAGRTRTFQILQGAEDSEFEKLTLVDSLFFSLSDTLFDDEGGLWVEIVKSNDLIDYARSSNQRNLSAMIDGLLNEDRVSETQRLVFDALMRIPNDGQFRQALDALSGASRENAVLYALSSPWQRPLNSIGFNRLSLALPTAENRAALRGQAFHSRLPRWSLSHDLWADLYYNYTHLSEDGNAPGGYGNRGGFFAGTALPSPSRESLLGISVGYSAAEYKQGRDKTDLGDFRIGLYGGANLLGRNLQLRGYLGYGIQDYKHHRAVQVGQYEPLAVTGKSSGDSISAAIYLIRPVDMSDRYLLKPMIGFDFESLSQDAFRESGIEAVALHYGDVTLDRLMWRIGATADYQFDRFEMNGRFLYGLKISGDNAAVSTHRFMSPGNDPFVIRSVNIGDYAFDLGFGGNWNLNRRRTAKLFFDYNANLTKNSGIHTTSLGVLWKR